MAVIDSLPSCNSLEVSTYLRLVLASFFFRGGSTGLHGGRNLTLRLARALSRSLQKAFTNDARIAALLKRLLHLGSGLRPSYSVPATSILVCTQPEAQVSLFHTCSFEMTLPSAKCKVQRTFHQLYPVVRGRVQLVNFNFVLARLRQCESIAKIQMNRLSTSTGLNWVTFTMYHRVTYATFIESHW